MATYLARMERIIVAEETAEVRLILLKDTDVVHINKGDEFVTVEMKIDPFGSR